MILNLLRQAVRRDREGKYALEEAIHKLVLPMRTTSDDVPIDQMNLWLIDERLAFHMYLASDKPFTTIEPVASESTQRPDVIVFNRAMAFSEDGPPSFQTVVIVEFKRPMRDEYDEKENPIAQVYEYIREVRKGIARQRDGRPLTVSGHVPFYCYIVCDLTPKLRQIAENHDLTQAWDNQGYFGYNSKLHAYVEIVSFDAGVERRGGRHQPTPEPEPKHKNSFCPREVRCSLFATFTGSRRGDKYPDTEGSWSGRAAQIAIVSGTQHVGRPEKPALGNSGCGPAQPSLDGDTSVRLPRRPFGAFGVLSAGLSRKGADRSMTSSGSIAPSARSILCPLRPWTSPLPHAVQRLAASRST